MRVSIVLPAKNEAAALAELLPRLAAVVTDSEIIVVDDGSSDDTAAVAKQHGASVVSHPYSMGNGAAVKAGARHATGEVIVFMDADGQHDPADISRLLDELGKGYDMVVGARTYDSHAGHHRALANTLYNGMASWMVGHRIPDLTSGFRAVRADKFRRFLALLPNGFSYPTTITMSFFRMGYSVGYLPIVARAREGRSHIRLIRDGMRFLLIIIRIGTLYSPLRLFLPVSFGFFLTGLSYYAYSYFSSGRFTNMSALLFISAILTFLIGIVSEQISALYYKDAEDPHPK